MSLIFLYLDLVPGLVLGLVLGLHLRRFLGESLI